MEPKAAGSAHTIWQIDCPYTTVEFTSKLLFFLTVKGSFSVREGRIILGSELSRSSVEVTIDAASVNTRNEKRDAHLRSADFFDVDAHPEIRFESTHVERGQDRDTLRVRGNLSIKGRSREILLNVLVADRSRSPQGYQVAYYSISTDLDRTDFGITHGGWLLGRTVKVSIHVQASNSV